MYNWGYNPQKYVSNITTRIHRQGTRLHKTDQSDCRRARILCDDGILYRRNRRNSWWLHHRLEEYESQWQYLRTLSLESRYHEQLRWRCWWGSVRYPNSEFWIILILFPEYSLSPNTKCFKFFSGTFYHGWRTTEIEFLILSNIIWSYPICYIPSLKSIQILTW